MSEGAGAGAGAGAKPKKKTKKAGGYLGKIIDAIRALKTPGGSSRQAIAKYLKAEHGLDNKKALAKALKKGVASGKLAQNKQSFAVAGDAAIEDTRPQLIVEDLKIGDGAVAESGSTVTVKYKGTLETKDGPQFDAASKFTFTLDAGEVIKGWDLGINGMREGGKRRLTVPPRLGYGKRGSPPEIPGGATLVMVVKLRQVHD